MNGEQFRTSTDGELVDVPEETVPEEPNQDIANLNQIAWNELKRLLNEDTSLDPHWKQALNLMIEKEIPKSLDEIENLIWSE